VALTEQYKKAGRRTVDHGRTLAERQLRQTRVLAFLDWCSCRGVQTFAGLRQEHYAGFIRRLQNDGLADRTIYRYRLALREFFRRWQIKIRVTTPKQKKTGAWKEDVRIILERIVELDPVLRARIVEELERTKANE
jgi:hypothetical protein